MTSFVDVFGNETVPPSNAAYVNYAITANSQLVWPNNYSGTDLLVGDITDISAGSGLTLTLPQANEVSVGQDILIRNIGANPFDILDYASGNVTTVVPGTAKYVFVTVNTTEAGTWGVFTYGTGTSGADASALAGSGLQANSNLLRVYAPYRGINSNYSLVASDRAKVLEVTVGSVTLSLQQASVAGDGYYVFIRNSSEGSVVVDGFGTEEVDGALNKTLAPGESAIFICNGSYWVTVGFGRDSEFVFSEVVVNMALGTINLSSADVAGRMIRLSGTAVGNVTVNLPGVDNIYFVNIEAGLGGFSATFTTGSGSDIILVANQKTVLYCDGVNINTAITTAVLTSLSLNDGSAAAPVISFAIDSDTGFFRDSSGTIGVASNGTATVLFGPLGVELGSVASSTTFSPAGDISATNVQAALQELDTEKVKKSIITTTGINKTIVNLERVMLTTGGLTITLPITPTAGDNVTIITNAFTNTTVGRNGQPIMGLAEDMTINRATVGVTLLYIDGTFGWRIV